ncbi:hypothetical protein J4G37_44770, partial [Microvirga sp. 3-52]|nr:hypothetical protein [Microvirga sp. 3-52]
EATEYLGLSNEHQKGRDIMTGHFQKRGKDSYLLVYPMGYNLNGKKVRKTKTVKAKNQTEAKKAFVAFMKEIETGSYATPSHIKDINNKEETK